MDEGRDGSSSGGGQVPNGDEAKKKFDAFMSLKYGFSYCEIVYDGWHC
jgi:hypothetical protein